MSIKLENVVLASPEQMEFIIQGMRNPMNSWEKSDSYCGCGSSIHREKCEECHICQYEGCIGEQEYFVGGNDHELMQRLSNAGTEHRKYMRMMPVYVRITAPLYWWKEFDTYKVGTVANSCSTMHKIAEKEFTLEDFSTEHLKNSPFDRDWITSAMVDEDDKSPHKVWATPLDILRYTIEMLNLYRTEYLETKSKDDWWQMIQLLPSSYNQTRNVMLNYEVLANIYRQRKNHKLDEWREVCKWIESLPYSELITVDSCEAIKEEVWKEIIKVREIPDPWEVHGTAEYAKMCPDQLITIAEMEADARRAIPADKIKTGSKED